MGKNDSQKTVKFKLTRDMPDTPKDILTNVYRALKEKGYDPINQLVGYFISGDPTYITSHNNARSLIRRLERDELLEELIEFYMREKE
ncbi:MAG: IreB family regulatory phosphoprotein [Clostridiales bacterium]|nr:IreB family regulatory phosphoprotein [Clostridiales bacterium]